MSGTEKDAYLLRVCTAAAQNRSKTQLYHISGFAVRTKGLQSLLGIGNKRHLEFIQLACAGAARHVRKQLAATTATNGRKAAMWLHTHCKQYGDIMPDTNAIQLPPCSLSEIHHDYVADLAERDEPYVSYPSYFMSIFQSREFKHVSIPKHKRFSKCAKCTYLQLREQREQIETS